MIKTREIDFTIGPILKKMILYALPIIGVNVLQLLFTMADLSVLGIFTKNDNAIAAVGAVTPIINLCIGFFTGLSAGANVLLARSVGAHDMEKSRKLVGISVTLSITCGLFLMIAGLLLAEQMLLWTNCAPTVLPYAATYLRIYFLGMPIIMLYNFCAAILRSVGDTVRPLIFLVIGGVLNVILNILFIVVVGWDIEGVAIATVVSNAVSGICAFVLIIKNEGYAKLEKKNIGFSRKEMLEIFQIGLPIALSKCLFSFANVLVSTELNTLGDVAMTAQSITKEFDGFILEALHGVAAATLAVTSQNYGAKKLVRIKRVMYISLLINTIISLTLGLILILFGRILCGIMTETQAVLDLCMVRITTVSIFYIVLGTLQVIQETIRGIGYSFTSILISIFANVIFRFIYLGFIYPFLLIEGNLAYNLRMLYIVYPACWSSALIVAIVVLVILYRKVKNRLENEQ